MACAVGTCGADRWCAKSLVPWPKQRDSPIKKHMKPVTGKALWPAINKGPPYFGIRSWPSLQKNAGDICNLFQLNGIFPHAFSQNTFIIA